MLLEWILGRSFCLLLLPKMNRSISPLLALGIVLLTGCSHAGSVQVTMDVNQKLADPNECMLRIRDGQKLVWPQTWDTKCGKFENADGYYCNVVFWFCQPTDESLRSYVKRDLESSVKDAERITKEIQDKLSFIRKLP